METKEQLVTNIKEWIKIDNEISQLKSEIKERNNKKKNLTENLVVTMKKNQIDCFDINGGALVYKQNKVKKSINGKSLLLALQNYYKNDTSTKSMTKGTGGSAGSAGTCATEGGSYSCTNGANGYAGNNGNDGTSKQQTNKTFPTMLKHIRGALIGGVNYEEIYMDSDLAIETNPPITPNNPTEHQDPNTHKIPTLHETARKVARLEKQKLDEKQYIAYEMIACTFLLGLVQDGNDPNKTLYSCLGQTMGGTATLKIRDIVHRLEARGGQNQLIMFLTGPAGSGKSTAMQVAQQFCYDFCLAVGVMWSDITFFFTAYTGAAASLFGGVTTSKAAFLNQQKALSLNDKNTWQDVRILIVDEVSFMSDKNLNTLDVKLKEIGNRAKPFGGYSIIFSGDFRQLEPVGSTELDLLFSSLSSKHWDNCIDGIIILDNDHRFKEDPEYGQMLKRMWNGDLTTEDRKRINSRVIGYNGLQLPSNIKGGEFKKRKFQN